MKLLLLNEKLNNIYKELLEELKINIIKHIDINLKKYQKKINKIKSEINNFSDKNVLIYQLKYFKQNKKIIQKRNDLVDDINSYLYEIYNF